MWLKLEILVSDNCHMHVDLYCFGSRMISVNTALRTGASLILGLIDLPIFHLVYHHIYNCMKIHGYI